MRLYRLAFGSIGRNWQFLAALAVVLVAIETSFSSQGVASLFVFAFVQMITHRSLILGEAYRWKETFSPNAPDGQRLPIFGFVVRYLAFFLILILIVSGAAGAMGAAGLNPGEQGAFLAAAVVPALLIFGLILALLGNVLAATAVGADTSLATALRRGRRHLGATFLHLLMGPVLVSLVGIGAASLPELLLPHLNDSLRGFLVTSLGSLGALITAVFTATALSLSYLDGEKTP